MCCNTTGLVTADLTMGFSTRQYVLSLVASITEKLATLLDAVRNRIARLNGSRLQGTSDANLLCKYVACLSSACCSLMHPSV